MKLSKKSRNVCYLLLPFIDDEITAGNNPSLAPEARKQKPQLTNDSGSIFHDLINVKPPVLAIPATEWQGPRTQFWGAIQTDSPQCSVRSQIGSWNRAQGPFQSTCTHRAHLTLANRTADPKATLMPPARAVITWRVLVSQLGKVVHIKITAYYRRSFPYWQIGTLSRLGIYPIRFLK